MVTLISNRRSLSIIIITTTRTIIQAHLHLLPHVEKGISK
jgi:hypothetical protein